MNVMALLEYLDEELSKSASVPLTGKRLVDVEKCLDIVSELRVTLPDDVKDAEVIVRDREQILADAQHQAEQIIADAHTAAQREHDKLLADAQKELKDLAVTATEKLVLQSGGDAFDQFLDAAERGEPHA